MAFARPPTPDPRPTHGLKWPRWSNAVIRSTSGLRTSTPSWCRPVHPPLLIVDKSSCACAVNGARRVLIGRPPNKRLKLAGGERFKGNGVVCPGGHGPFVQHPCARGRGDRRLKASPYAGPPPPPRIPNREFLWK